MNKQTFNEMSLKVKKFEELDTKINNLQKDIDILNKASHVGYVKLMFENNNEFRTETLSFSTYDSDNKEFKNTLKTDILRTVKLKFEYEINRLKREIEDL